MINFCQSLDNTLVQNNGELSVLGAFKEYAIIELDIVHKIYADINNLSLARVLCYKCFDDTDLLYNNCSEFLDRSGIVNFPVTFTYVFCVGGITDELSSEGVVNNSVESYHTFFYKNVQNKKEFNEQINKNFQRFQFLVPYSPSQEELNQKKNLIYLDKNKMLKLHTYPSKNNRAVYDFWGNVITPTVVSLYRLSQ